MKNRLIASLQELISEANKSNFTGIKVSIMQNTAFLAKPSTGSVVSEIMNTVNTYIQSPTDSNRANVEKVIQLINEKF